MDNIFEPFRYDKVKTGRRRNLPHWDQPGATYFVTFRTADSLPVSAVKRLDNLRKLWVQTHPRPWDIGTCEEYNQILFSLLDRKLDGGFGACHLRDPSLSKVVEEALLFFDQTRYYLDEYSVMPNHVHSLVKPLDGYTLSRVLHSWKSYTAKLINQKLGKKGVLWMPESFDRIVRSWFDLLQIRDYIRKNPKKARLKSGEFRYGRGVGIVMPKE